MRKIKIKAIISGYLTKFYHKVFGIIRRNNLCSSLLQWKSQLFTSILSLAASNTQSQRLPVSHLVLPACWKPASKDLFYRRAKTESVANKFQFMFTDLLLFFAFRSSLMLLLFCCVSHLLLLTRHDGNACLHKGLSRNECIPFYHRMNLCCG